MFDEHASESSDGPTARLVRRVREMRDEKRQLMIDAVLDARTIEEANLASTAFAEAFPNDPAVRICANCGGLTIDCPDDCPERALEALDRRNG